MKPATLQGRLAVGLILSLVVLLGLQWVLVRDSATRMARQQMATRLAHDAESLVVALGAGDVSELSLGEPRPAPIYHRVYSGHYFQLRVDGETLRSRSLWRDALPMEPLAPGEVVERRVAGPDGQTLLMRTAGYEIEGRRVTLATAEDLGELETRTAAFTRRHATLSGVLIALLIVVQVLVVRFTLRPLELSRRELREVAGGRRERLTEAVPREVLPLVREVNRLIEALEQRLTRSRNALGNLAHALKTPLARISRAADAPAVHANPELRERLTGPVDEIGRLVERELGRARLAARAGVGRRFQPARDIPGLLRAIEQAHAARGIAVDLEIDPAAPERGDREDMFELLGNLLDNAFKWASGQVRIRVGPGPGLHFVIEDDGPGMTETERAAALERGRRLDESRRGSGLGLAIAGDVVDAYGGALRLGRGASLPGLRVEVSLPP